ncbi:MAG: arsenate reductase ArsC [Actinobacteria bacterium]|nr:arsenate reductase ArsC [Actinomycetota bacterium]MCL5447393.1 arsenate reductase ArsC [Actinomycetota bacterium]
MVGNGKRPLVLFVCVHNAGRSQMAAALLAKRSNGQVDVRSAGSAPANEINPVAVEVMREVGVDISAATPKLLTLLHAKEADVVITMGCGDACPVYPGKRYLSWDVEDPSGKDIITVRRIRDDIDTLVAGLLEEIVTGSVL